MNNKIKISYEAAKRILVEMLMLKDLLDDKEVIDIIMKILAEKRSDTKKVYSTIVIDRECRLFFPGFSPKEVQMPYLLKTVFFLFLFQKEGFRYKMMENYQEELLRIYLIVVRDRNVDCLKVKSTILRLINSEENRIYEVSCRIHRILEDILPDNVCEDYKICGVKGKRYRITIDRQLLHIENEGLRKIAQQLGGKE